jgi:ketosteroid isomerase-like protein
MKKTLLLFIFSLFFIGCQTDQIPELSQEQKDKAHKEIIDVMREYNTAIEKKDFAGIVHTLSKDVIFFGSDSAEAIKSLTEFKEVIQKQWKFYDEMKYGDIQNPAIFMDNLGTFASIIYGIPCTFKEAGKSEIGYFYLRVARTLKKEKGKWVIISGIVSVTNSGKIHEEPKDKQD